MLEVKEVLIDNLKEWQYNPREISKREFESLKRSIKEFGMVQPLVVQKKTNQIIAGHQSRETI